MGKNLVIVESPAKAKTIAGYLGKDFEVKSSYGHIRDLPKDDLSIDIENNFEPTYAITADKKDVIKDLIKSVKKSIKNKNGLKIMLKNLEKYIVFKTRKLLWLWKIDLGTTCPNITIKGVSINTEIKCGSYSL